ncbi:MAG: DUF4198 domain-containing protein [Desulfonatronovibrio sp.]
MKNLSLKVRLLFFTLLLTILPGFVCAHHLWVDASSEGFLVKRGILPDDVHDYDPSFVTDIRMIDRNARELSFQKIDGPKGVMLKTEEKPELVIVTCKWGNRVNTPEGKKFMSRKEALDKGIQVESSFTSTQFSKTYFPPYNTWTKAMGLPLEILPLEEFQYHQDNNLLPVKILFQDTPLSESMVRLRPGDVNIKTNEQGIAQIPLSEKGPYTIIAFHTVPEDDNPEIDYRQFMSFIKFDLP